MSSRVATEWGYSKIENAIGLIDEAADELRKGAQAEVESGNRAGAAKMVKTMKDLYKLFNRLSGMLTE